LSNSARPDELDEDEPDAALGVELDEELGLDEDESLDEELGLDEPPVADEGEDDLLLCAMGEELELLELDFDASLA
jgi:hypothetical protein